MAVRKAAKIKTIWVPEKWLDRDEVKQLQLRGHSVVTLEKITSSSYVADTPDLILCEQAHRWNETLWSFWPAVLSRLKGSK